MTDKVMNFDDWERLNEGAGVHKYGCAMIYFNFPQMKEFHSQIEEGDLYIDEEDPSYGLEEEPHATVLYGIHDNEIDPNKVMEVLESMLIPNMMLKNVSMFDNEKYDVLKFDVQAPVLHELNKKLTTEFPYTTDYPDYHPHATVAYLKKGQANKYIQMFHGREFTVTPKSLVYSRPDGDKITRSYKK
jgi:2'-5' RNA ligase